MRETSASQAVVCQALKRLAKLGLLISSHGHGTFVNRKRNDGKPQILALFPRYESHTFSELRQELLIAANELQVELVTREVPLNEDFLSPLESCTADAVILMEQPAPRLTFQQITQVVNSPVPTVFCGRKVAVPGIQYVAGNAEAAGLIAALVMARSLTIMGLGDEVSRELGANTRLIRLVGTIVVLVLSAIAVIIIGPVGYVGLMVPHIVRHIVGTDYRLILPSCAVLGAVLVVLVDLLARVIIAPLEFPVGILITMIGVPFFIFVSRRQRGTFS